MSQALSPNSSWDPRRAILPEHDEQAEFFRNKWGEARDGLIRSLDKDCRQYRAEIAALRKQNAELAEAAPQVSLREQSLAAKLEALQAETDALGREQSGAQDAEDSPMRTQDAEDSPMRTGC